MSDELKNTETGAEDGMDTAAAIAEATRDIASQEVSMPAGLGALSTVSLTLSVELGRARLPISEILNLSPGSVVELDHLASEPVDLRVNDTLFARGEVVVVDDYFSVKITELLDTPPLVGN